MIDKVFNKEKFIGKICKVYLSKESNEIEDKECWFSFGIITDVYTGIQKMKDDDLILKFYTLKPIAYIPTEIDYYCDAKRGKNKLITWTNKYTKHRQDRRSPIVHEIKKQ